MITRFLFKFFYVSFSSTYFRLNTSSVLCHIEDNIRSKTVASTVAPAERGERPGYKTNKIVVSFVFYDECYINQWSPHKGLHNKINEAEGNY